MTYQIVLNELLNRVSVNLIHLNVSLETASNSVSVFYKVLNISFNVAFRYTTIELYKNLNMFNLILHIFYNCNIFSTCAKRQLYHSLHSALPPTLTYRPIKGQCRPFSLGCFNSRSLEERCHRCSGSLLICTSRPINFLNKITLIIYYNLTNDRLKIYRMYCTVCLLNIIMRNRRNRNVCMFA